MLPPGSRAPALWQTYRFVTAPEAYTRYIQRKYGDAARFHSLLGKGVGVFEAGLAREVFAAPSEAFDSVPFVEAVFGATAVIAVAGAPHRRLRKLLNPPFHGAQVRGFLGAMQRAVRANLGTFERAARTGVPVVMNEVSQSIAIDVILETVFGAGDLDRAVARQVLVDAVRAVSPAIVGGEWLHKAWFPPWGRFMRARAGFDRWVDGIVRDRRARGRGAEGDDVLGVLLSARYDDGSGMEDREVRDQLFTLLLAGHETSATATAWCIHYLLRNPDVLAKLRTEIDQLGADPTPEAIAKLPYLDAVVSETLRIEPIVTDVARVCREPLTLGGRWTVPAGETVVVMLAFVLRDARVFAEPELFRPERFLEKRFAAWEFLPFGGGTRRCLGATFAQAELALSVAEIAARWDLALVNGGAERSVRRNLTMGPKNGVPVRVVGPRPPPALRAAS
jgi:cytochrome P450